MLQDVKDMLVARYGDHWLNGVKNQNGIAQDLTVQEADATRTRSKFGLISVGIYLSTETEVVASYEVVRPANNLVEIDAMFYTWWGHRASENISFIQRELGDDEVIYHFITGTPTHGHSGRIVLSGRVVQDVIRRRWDERMSKIKAKELQESDTSATNT